VTESDDKSITVMWKRPEATGRRDFYYEILISAGNDMTRTVVESPYKDNRSVVDYTIPNLRPFTGYAIFVTTLNGVSEEDSENNDRRTTQVNGRTKEGGKHKH
jgi:hypothetical protein